MVQFRINITVAALFNSYTFFRYKSATELGNLGTTQFLYFLKTTSIQC